MEDSPVFRQWVDGSNTNTNTTTINGMPNWNPAYDVDYAKQPTKHHNGPTSGIALALNVPVVITFHDTSHHLVYHGSGDAGVSGIDTANGDVRPGCRQAYANEKTCTGQKVGTGTYTSPQLEEALAYAKDIFVPTCKGQRVFKVVLMCRVNDVRVPVSRPEYWVCGKCTAYKALVLGGDDEKEN